MIKSKTKNKKFNHLLKKKDKWNNNKQSYKRFQKKRNIFKVMKKV